MQARAVARYVRYSPRKLRRHADLIRGKHLQEVRAILGLASSPAAKAVRKVVESAAANAENNYDMKPEDLYLTDITVDDGFTFRGGWRPRARGRADRRRRRTSHITVVLDDEVAQV
ncbi:MAG: 50S ribosomal protein L22 [Armatimonadota bacterium]